MHSVTLLGGEKLRPIQAGEQQSPSAVFYSAIVVGEEALGEDIQQLLKRLAVTVTHGAFTPRQHNATAIESLSVMSVEKLYIYYITGTPFHRVLLLLDIENVWECAIVLLIVLVLIVL